MSAGYRQQPGNSSSKRKDGKRVAGKQVFPPPGSGGSRPIMEPRDLNFIPESVGGKEPQPAGSHIHDRIRTGTVVGKSLQLVDSNAKVTGQAGMVMMLDCQTRPLVKYSGHPIIMQK